MIGDQQVLELLVDWEELWKQGTDVPAEELCMDCPTLLEAVKQGIVKLKRDNAILDPLVGEKANHRPGEPETGGDELIQGKESDGEAEVSQPFRLDWPAVPGYQILGVLGRSLNVVYKARHERLQCLVALKMIRDDRRFGPEERARFRTEAEAVADLRHPNIVQIYDIGEHEGKPYLSLEYCAGGSLASKIAGTPQPAKHAARLVETLARAMHAAHQRGIMHRDLKPANILLSSVISGPLSLAGGERRSVSDYALRTTDYGLPKIADFGLAKRLEDPAGPTQTGAILGTPSYMAPEQAGSSVNHDLKADRGGVGPAVDIYALGAILYELLTGRPPFKGPTPLDTMLQVMHDEPLPPSRLQSRLPTDMETICLKCLQKEPSKRYTTAHDLAEDLRRFQAGEPIQARPVGTVERCWRWCRRNPLLAAAGGLAAAALIGVAVVSAVFGVSSTTAANKLQKALDDAKEQRTAAEERQVNLQVTNGVKLMDEGDYFGALPWFVEALEGEKGGPEREKIHRLRIGEILCRCPHLVQLLSHDASAVHAQFSPDGRRIATASQDQTARVWDLATGKPVCPPLKHSDNVNYAVFSSDGTRLVTASRDKTARVWEVVTGELSCPPLNHIAGVDLAVFSPDGRLVVTASRDNTAQLWNARTGQPTCSPLKHDGIVFFAAFSPDGALVITTSEDGMARLWNATTGQPVSLPMKHEGAVVFAAFSPDGRRVVTASGDMTARVWILATGRPAFAPLRHKGNVRQATFSPDGSRIITVSGDETAQIWDAGSGQPACPALSHRSGVRFAAFSPDGRRVLTASDDRTGRVWDVASGKPLSPPFKNNGPVFSASFSADASLIAFGGWDSTVSVWNLTMTEPLSLSLNHSAEVRNAAFSPDGNRLVTASWDQTGLIWNLATGQPHTRALKHHDPVLYATFSHDGRLVVTTSLDHTARIWDVESGQEAAPPLMHNEGVVHAAFSPDGRRVITASVDHTARIWNVAGGETGVMILHHKAVVRYGAFSPDGRLVVTACEDGTARVWNAQTGKPHIPPLKHGDIVYCASFSPNGDRVVTASLDHTAQVWNADTGSRFALPMKHTDAVLHCEFSPDGRRIVTASRDQTARVWNAETCQPIARPMRHNGEVWDAAFSPEGARVVTSSWDQTARIWDVETGQPITPPLKHNHRVRHASFSPNGRRIVTVSWDRSARVWELSYSAKSLSELRLLCQSLTRQQMDPGGAESPLAGKDIGLAWQTLREKYPADLAPASPDQVLAWHRHEAEECESAEAWFAAVFHLNHLIEAQPANGTPRWRRGFAWKHLDQADKAAADFAKALELKTDEEAYWRFRGDFHADQQDHQQAIEDFSKAIALNKDTWYTWQARGSAYAYLEEWEKASKDYFESMERGWGSEDAPYWHALTVAAAGDIKGYQQACELLVKRFGGFEDTKICRRLARVCTYLPEAVRDYDKILTSVEKPAGRYRNDFDYLTTLGIVLYRAGKFGASVQKLDEANKLFDKENPAVNWLFLAMGHQRLGHTEEAENWLHKALHRIEQAPLHTSKESSDARLSWERQLEVRLLRHETEEVVRRAMP